MNGYVLLFAFLISCSNIALNILAAKTASSVNDWHSMFRTDTFVLAFFVGMGSLVFMLSLYFSGRNHAFGMANGILLMGATSIIGGTLVGYLLLGSKVHWSEWCIFVLIFVFILLRFWLATRNVPT